MWKIASPQDLQAELQRLLAYSQGYQPSRTQLASELRGLAERVAGNSMTGTVKVPNMAYWEEVRVAGGPFRVELLVRGKWVDSGESFHSRFDAAEYGLDHGVPGRPGRRNHPKYGYATEDKTWRVKGPGWSGATT